MELKNVKQCVYAVALDYEGVPRASDGDHRAVYERRFGTDGGFEKALADFFLRRGDFDDDAEFGGDTDYTLT